MRQLFYKNTDIQKSPTLTCQLTGNRSNSTLSKIDHQYFEKVVWKSSNPGNITGGAKTDRKRPGPEELCQASLGLVCR